MSDSAASTVRGDSADGASQVIALVEALSNVAAEAKEVGAATQADHRARRRRNF